MCCYAYMVLQRLAQGGEDPCRRDRHSLTLDAVRFTNYGSTTTGFHRLKKACSKCMDRFCMQFMTKHWLTNNDNATAFCFFFQNRFGTFPKDCPVSRFQLQAIDSLYWQFGFPFVWRPCSMSSKTRPGTGGQLKLSVMLAVLHIYYKYLQIYNMYKYVYMMNYIWCVWYIYSYVCICIVQHHFG